MDGKALKLRRFLERAGLRVDSMRRSGGGHYKVIATKEANNGFITRTLFLPASPSDHRWEANQRSQIKKVFSRA